MEEFAFLTTVHSWGPGEVKSLSARQRRFWIELAIWRMNSG